MVEYFKVGQIINTHGIQGEIKVNPLTDDINRFKNLKRVLLDGQERAITSVKFQKDKVILKIEGINSMDDAMRCKGKYLEINRKDAVPLEENSYFISDLLNCKVFDTEGVEIGKMYDVIKTGNNDVYWIKGDKEVLVPALKNVVVNVDMDNLKIIIKPIREWQE
ncbi:ribosome maturation factor RimM [Haloimpatiens sp. FM7315]|uniref:ribosome maturation factor RimM n=1 Tax=Haloimpatiens sp. FM7315 TaxID=3298609 RepID=UPI0035A311FE